MLEEACGKAAMKKIRFSSGINVFVMVALGTTVNVDERMRNAVRSGRRKSTQGISAEVGTSVGMIHSPEKMGTKQLDSSARQRTCTSVGRWWSRNTLPSTM
jgi:hypothetical protein